jgi:hypothetical protein
VAAPPGASQVSLYPIFDIKFIRNFLEFFEKLDFRGFFRIGKLIKTQKNEDEMISSKSKPSMQ